MDCFGYLYVLTTESRRHESVYKIGSTADLSSEIRRLNTGNGSIIEQKNLFFPVKFWRTFNYSMLENILHNMLSQYRIGNKIYQCELKKIDYYLESCINHYKYTDFINDGLYLFGIENKIKWCNDFDCFFMRNKPSNNNEIIYKFLQYLSFSGLNLVHISSRNYEFYLKFLKEKFPDDETSIANLSI